MPILRIIPWTSSLLSIKIWSIYLLKCVLIYGKRVIDSRHSIAAKAGDKGGKVWQSLSQQQRTRMELLFWTLRQKQLELNFGESIKIVQGWIHFHTGMPSLTGQPLQLQNHWSKWVNCKINDQQRWNWKGHLEKLLTKGSITKSRSTELTRNIELE